jgi:hypothetical protein
VVTARAQRFCGRNFSREEVCLIQEIVETCGGVSRTELAYTVCELLEWKRANGKLKGRECLDFLERLEEKGLLTLPGRRETTRWSASETAPVGQGDRPWADLMGSVEAFSPVELDLVKTEDQRRLFRELTARYHYLGYKRPFGARLRYLAYVTRPTRVIVGCIQFSSPSWRMKVRDQWIGWDDATRGERLQHVVQNSRLLILPRIRNLASRVLALALRRLGGDWESLYGLQPWLVETLVDRRRFQGSCYLAGNWVELGQTSGRGRMDRFREREGAEVKTVLVYPLVKDATSRLREGR